LGCTFYYLATQGTHPYGKDYLEREKNILKKKCKLENQTPLDQALIHLISIMLEITNDYKQPTQLLQHPFFWPNL
jgi:hypothetical protein